MIHDLFRHLRIHTATKPKQVKNTGTVIDKIKKAENAQAKAVNNLVKILGKKGLKREATNLASAYMKGMRKFNDFLKKTMRKLV